MRRFVATRALERGYSENAMAGSRSILIADDNRDWTDSLAVILRDAGYTVYTAYDGREAIEAASTALPDVVLLDIGMPKLTGYEVARIFHRHPDATRPVLVAVTAWGREADKLRAQVAGFDYHLTKPVQPEAIVELLEKLGERHAPRRRILIVDDNRASTDSLANLLQVEGHSVRTASDSQEAAEAAVGFGPDIVILELRTPGMSGHEAARRFRRQPPAGPRPLLIAVSAVDTRAEREAALKAGFDYFVPRPVALDALSPMLAQAPTPR